MTGPCPTRAELPILLALPADDLRRRHLADCPRCRALALACAEFLDPAAGDDPQLEEADARLAARLREAIDRDGAPARTRSRGRDPLGRILLAAAAVLALCAGIVAVREAVLTIDARPPAGAGPWRGAGTDSTRARWQRADGGWRLAWDRERFDRPVLQYLDRDLRELRRLPLAADLAAPVAPAEAVHLRLLFVAAGDTVARSALLPARPAAR